MDEPRKPWYARPLPLPRWLPEWVLLCLVFAGTLAFVASFIPRDAAYVFPASATGFGVGFLFGVWASSIAARRAPGWKAPPFWLAFPVHVAALAGAGALTVADPVIHGRYGGTLLKGPPAVAVGVALILAGLGLSCWTVVGEMRRPSRAAAGVVGLLLSLAAAAYALVTIWHRGG